MRVLAPFLVSVAVVVVGGLALNGILTGGRDSKPQPKPETPQDDDEWRQT